jgi:hypothetical protein
MNLSDRPKWKGSRGLSNMGTPAFSIQPLFAASLKNNQNKIGAPVLHCLSWNGAGVDVGAAEIYIRAPLSRRAIWEAILEAGRPFLENGMAARGGSRSRLKLSDTRNYPQPLSLVGRCNFSVT